MVKGKNNFIEVCLYEVKPDKTGVFENLIKEVAKHHAKYPGVIDVKQTPGVRLNGGLII